MSFKYNVFISHASEDKDLIARPISNALSKYGLKVWFDEMSLSMGDSLSRSIDKGLSESEFGIVILSPSFFEKNWSDYELRGLTARELRGKKVILPIWHKVDVDDVIQYSPTLADKMAISTGQKTPDEISLKIIEVICPELLTKIHTRQVYLELQKSSKDRLVSVNIKDLKFLPPRHKELPGALISRIRLIRSALLGVYPHSMNFWVDGFRADTHPSQEILWWERLSTCYLEYIQMHHSPCPDQSKLAFNALLLMALGSQESILKEILSKLPENSSLTLSTLLSHRYPPYEVEEELPSDVEMTAEDYPECLKNIDADDYMSLDRYLC